MTIPSRTKQWRLKNLPQGHVNLEASQDATFELVEQDLPTLQTNQLLLQAVYFSNDPAQRAWIQKDQDPDRMYRSAPHLGDPMPIAFGIWKVLESTSSSFSEGCLINSAEPGWAQFAVIDADLAQAVPTNFNVPIPTLLGALGNGGLAAWFGLTEILHFESGQSLLISDAAGAVGNVVVQLARNVFGASKIVAIAGTDEKCEWLKTIGAHECINYKSKTFVQDLKTACQEKVDAYFDNVGSYQLDEGLAHVKQGGIVAACGSISTYNTNGPANLQNYTQVIFQRLTIRGFLLRDFRDKFASTQATLAKAVKDGRISTDGAETLIKVPFDRVPHVWLFSGESVGKLVTQVAEE